MNKLAQSWTVKDNHIKTFQEQKAQSTDFRKELWKLKKQSQEERLDQQTEWGKRFSAGVAS